jgi:hypothetical protein
MDQSDEQFFDAARLLFLNWLTIRNESGKVLSHSLHRRYNDFGECV